MCFISAQKAVAFVLHTCNITCMTSASMVLVKRQYSPSNTKWINWKLLPNVAWQLNLPVPQKERGKDFRLCFFKLLILPSLWRGAAIPWPHYQEVQMHTDVIAPFSTKKILKKNSFCFSFSSGKIITVAEKCSRPLHDIEFKGRRVSFSA